MKVKKKLASMLSLLLILFLSVSVFLIGCGSKDNADSNATGTSQASGTTTQEKSEPYNLTVYYPCDKQDDLALVQDKLNEYLQGKINATVTLNLLDWGSVKDKMNLIIASQEQTDILFNPSWLDFYSNVAKGAYLPLDDLLEKYGQGIKQTINPTFLDGPRVKGKLYAIPTNKELAQSWGIKFFKDYVDKYDIDISKFETFTCDKAEEYLEPIFKLFKEKEPNLTPLFISDGNGALTLFRQDVQYFVPTVSTGCHIYVKKGDTSLKVYNEIDDPMDVQLKYYNILRKWYKLGYINQDAAVVKPGVGDEAQKQEKMLCWGGNSKPGSAEEWSNITGHTVVGVDFMKPYVTTDAVVGSQFGISTTSKNPEAAMKFLNLLHTDAYVVNLLNYGIEGTHYTKKSENVVERVADSKYKPDITWMIGNQFLDYLKPNESPTKWEDFKKFNETAEVSQTLGFTFDVEPVKTELAAITNIDNQYNNILGSGAADPEPVLKERNAKLKAAGIDKIKAEVQKQLDEWAKTKK